MSTNTNVAVLRGQLSSPPRTKVLASGDQLVALELTAKLDGGPADTVPVAWFGAPDPAPAWEAGQELVVVGRVRRRYFRAGATTASRTEVVAATVVAGNRKAAVAKAVADALAQVGAAAEP